MLVAQLCLTLCDPTNCNPPGSSVHEILQARILEWIAIPFSKGSSRPRDWTQVSCIAGRFFTVFFSLPVYLALSPVPKDCFPLPSPHASRDKDSKGAAGITQEEKTLIYAYVHQFSHPQRWSKAGARGRRGGEGTTDRSVWSGQGKTPRLGED